MNDSKLMELEYSKKHGSLIYSCYIAVICDSKKFESVFFVKLEPNLPLVQAKTHPAEHLPPWPSFLGYVCVPLLLMAEIQQ